MCDFITPVVSAIGGLFGSGASTAAGAAAGAATAGGALQSLGTLVGIGGSLMQGISTYQAGKAQARVLEEQAATEARLTAVKDNRARAQFRSAMSAQIAELAARGISLDSPTAITLGQSAAAEMSFESQAIRSDGAARQTELSAARRVARGRATSGLLNGVFDAGGKLLSAAPELWPELLA